MDVAEYFNWGVNAQNHWLFLQHAHALISQGKDVLSSECKVAISIVLSGPFSWSEQMRQEQIVEGVLGLS